MVLWSMQVIKKWYAKLPEKLGKELAKQRKKNQVQKSEKERLAECEKREEKWFNREGLSDSDVEEAVHDEDYERDPVTAGQD